MEKQQSLDNADNKAIGRIWLTGQTSPTLVIPKKLAMEYRLDRPSHVILEKMEGGILIRKFELEKFGRTKVNKISGSRDVGPQNLASRESREEK